MRQKRLIWEYRKVKNISYIVVFDSNNRNANIIGTEKKKIVRKYYGEDGVL